MGCSSGAAYREKQSFPNPARRERQRENTRTGALKTAPNDTKTGICPAPYPQYYPPLKRGIQRRKSPKMIPRNNIFTDLSAYTSGSGRKEREMPRMSKKRRLEWSFFLNHRNRITYNDLCRGCTHGCKQSFRAIIVLCPRYFSKRWKHREDTANGR